MLQLSLAKASLPPKTAQIVTLRKGTGLQHPPLPSSTHFDGGSLPLLKKALKDHPSRLFWAPLI